MRASRAFAVTAAAFAAVGLAAPLAVAGGGPGKDPVPTHVTVDPSRVHQGATLQISAEGCGHSGGKVWSNAFPTVDLSPGRVGYATARIRPNATPGQYSLSVKCNAGGNNFGGDGGSGGNGGNGGNEGGRDDAEGRGNADGVATARFTVLPSRGAQGGLGGSMGPSSTEMQIGGGLVAAAALGGAVFVVRRRTGSNAAA
ncbi:hypothetical protein [Streptomyces nitrosporeus]|uniref:LPXTG cell wall anchor domain-containing protein n=1 Tax=Streptomyces nitrosporeus TaxID=28894 RepID=A0A5J6F2P5_9ACTN|nr:hypothetical protein [Streptomyces nitrosporeus]QEU70678.1 hypothetical protein CP967_00720 [Streptomyces nitrosporeus]GGZ06208.1 hypothetical protein GCM10010327_41000 [Streptomyces nitrosporeus]